MGVNGSLQTAVENQTIVVKADVDSLRRHWPFVRERLLVIKDACQRPDFSDRANDLPITVRGRARWTPEQVRFEILKGLSGNSSCELFFFLNEQTKEIEAFIVTTCGVDPFEHVPVDFFVWLGWSGTPALIERADPLVCELARERGCTAVEHVSPRLGWARRLKRHGYNLKFVHYRKELVD